MRYNQEGVTKKTKNSPRTGHTGCIIFRWGTGTNAIRSSYHGNCNMLIKIVSITVNNNILNVMTSKDYAYISDSLVLRMFWEGYLLVTEALPNGLFGCPMGSQEI